MNSSPYSQANSPATDSEGRRNQLDSWKEIASFLGRSEKTVRRWEETEGLPVHRLHHEKRASVYAYTAELEQWRETRKRVVEHEPAPADAGVDGKNQPPSAQLEDVKNGTSRPARRGLVWLVAGVIVAISSLGALVGMHWGRLRDSPAAKPSLVRIQSLAVLPFKNISGDAEQEYFAEGMTEQLITEIARTSAVRVISRTSVMRYKDTRKSVSEITRELNVEAVVEGAVLRAGSRIRISVQLVTPFPERHIWANVYEGNIRDVLDLQRDAAHDVSSKIGAKPAARPPLSSGGHKGLDPETYEGYLRARHFLARRDAEGMKKALAGFQAVLQRDPEYAPAYAGVALAYDVLGSYEVLPPEKSFPSAKSFASRALQLDNTLAEAYTARAIAASFWEFNWLAADRDFQHAIALDPNSELVHHWYAEHLLNIDKADRAVTEMKRARELDPLSLSVNATLGRIYRDARQYVQALEQCRKTLELDPNIAMGHWCLGQVYIGEHRYAPAIQELQLANTLGTTPLILRDLAWVYAAVGNKSKANAILAGLMRKAQDEYMSPYSLGIIHGALGKKDEAFRYLNEAFAERDSQIAFLKLDPQLDPLRSDPRFDVLLARLHIPR